MRIPAPETRISHRLPPAAVRELARSLPDARFVPVPDCGHSVYFENPAIFNQLVFDFLRSVAYAPDSIAVAPAG